MVILCCIYFVFVLAHVYIFVFVSPGFGFIFSVLAKKLAGKRLQNDLICVEWDVMP